MKFQFLSDTHFETTTRLKGRLRREAPILVLAGDIGNPFHETYRLFLERCSVDFDHVIVILGNHEYYQRKSGRHMSAVENQVRLVVEPFDNVHFLHNSSIKIDDTIFYGTPLWTFIPDKHQSRFVWLNDFQKITILQPDGNVQAFTTQDYNQIHREQLTMLHDFLERLNSCEAQHKLVVVTHHCPLWIPHPKYPVENAYAFNVDLLKLIERYEPDVWIYGHTHYPDSRVRGKTIVATNPKGYAHEFKPTEHDRYFPIKCIEF